MIEGLDGEILRQHGYAIATDGKHIRDADGHWWRMAWSSHTGRWESSVAHVDRVLGLAATEGKGNG